MKTDKKRRNVIGLASEVLFSVKKSFLLLIMIWFYAAFDVWLSTKVKEGFSNLVAGVTKGTLGEGEGKILLLIAGLYTFGHYFTTSFFAFLKNTLYTLVITASLVQGVQKTVNLKNRDFHKLGHGKCHENIQNSSLAIGEVVGLSLVEIPRSAFAIFYYTYLFTTIMNPSMLFMFMSGISICVGVGVMITWFVKKSESKIIELYRASLVVLTDVISNFDIVQSFNAEEYETKRYEGSLRQFKKTSLKAHGNKEFLAFVQKYMILIPHFITLYLVIKGHSMNLIFYNGLFVDYKNNFIKIRDNIFLLTKRYVEASCILDGEEEERQAGLVKVVKLKDGILAKDMELQIGNDVISRGLNFKIDVGDKVAITGDNGSGKSTFLKTLLRFHNNGGRLEIDGTDIKEIDITSIRNLFSYVPQDYRIMNDTVLSNLKYGNRLIDDEGIYKACSHYGCHEFFKKLPNGYLTLAGENGDNLSGGQKQRISFMRAVIRGSPVILLDEPTSALDKKSEQEFLESVVSIAQDRTVIMIIHNLDHLKLFNKILYFKRDGVDLYTSYEEFLKKDRLDCSPNF